MINKIKASKKVYNKFFAKKGVVINWANNGQLSSNSNDSFGLSPAVEDILIERFNIENKELFKSKYEEAVSGDGQEARKITTLHSSSLIALLCFYNVSKDHKLQLGNYTFHESYFEVKTKVGSKPSNMDVVLRGTDRDNNNVVLFLESKFSEYLKPGKAGSISYNTYFNLYDKLNLFDVNPVPIDYISFKNVNGALSIEEENQATHRIYCEGIKQMLSHYKGVSGYNEKRAEALNKHKRFKADNDEKVILGEILFDFGADESKDLFDNYKHCYSQLANIINSKDNKFTMLSEIITYQDLFKKSANNSILDKVVKEFYGL